MDDPARSAAAAPRPAHGRSGSSTFGRRRRCSTEEHAERVRKEIRVSVSFRKTGDTEGGKDFYFHHDKTGGRYRSNGEVLKKFLGARTCAGTRLRGA